MSCKTLPFELLDIGVAEEISSKGIEIEEGERKQTHTEICVSGDEEWIASGNIGTGLRLDHEQDSTAEGVSLLSKYQHEQRLIQLVGFDDLYFDVVSPPLQSFEEEIRKLFNSEAENIKIIKSEKEKPYAASLEILNKHGNRLKRLHSENLNLSSYPVDDSRESQKKLSIPAILRLAGEMFIQSVSSKHSELSILDHPYASSFSELSKEDTKNLQLLQFLLSAAEKTGEKQFLLKP